LTPHSSPFPTRRSSDLLLHLAGDTDQIFQRPFVAQSSFQAPVFVPKMAMRSSPAHQRFKLAGPYWLFQEPKRAQLVHCFYSAVQDRKSTRLNSSHEWIS